MVLSAVQGSLAAQVPGFVADFYDRLWKEQGPRDVLRRLSQDELARLQRAQAEHLLALLDPDLDEEQARARARRIGRVLAMVGAEIEWYADAVTTHHQQIFDAVAAALRPEDRARMHSTVARRLMHDLQAALSGFRVVDGSQHRATVRVNELAGSACTVPDLVRGVLEAITGLDGVTTGFFGRPDEHDVFQFEMGLGAGADEFIAEVGRRDPLTITVLGHEASGQGPLGRAWRTGGIERADAYRLDPTTAPWHQLAARLGWRSSVAIPVCDARGRTRALMSFYSPWPGFFAPSARQALLQQVRQLLERTLAALEVRGAAGSDVRAYRARSTYLKLLQAAQVEMVFQPIVELAGGRLTKVEALARLRGDDRLLSPAEFLPAFGNEELARLFELGLDQALAAMRSWTEQGLPIDVSLNLPPVAAHDERYVAMVESALSRHRVLPSRLTLELLETGYVDWRARWGGQVLDQLKALGVRLAQDDLGTGYSSLLRLRHFPFDDVKLDQSLVRGQEFSPRGALNFIKPLTDLVHSMGLDVVVEGLENRGLIEAALMLGADAGQGYGISRPLSSDDLVEWARGFRLHLDTAHPSTRLGGLAAHVAWEHRLAAFATSHTDAAMAIDSDECGLDRYIEGLEDLGGHLAQAHAAVHAAARRARGGEEHMRWWRVLTKMLGVVAPAAPRADAPGAGPASR